MSEAPVELADTVRQRVGAYRPRLPCAERLLPYLRRIDAARVYSNHGPLVAELESRLGTPLGLGYKQFISAASGTAALVAGILAAAGRATPERPYALCPAYTFIGTASALEQCGYTPWLVDVDESRWQADAERLRGHPQLGRVGVVVPVAAYGRPVPLAPWERFRAATGVAVVVDGAASLEGLVADPGRTVGAIPVALSFHATKAFATGEGGAILVRDEALAQAAFRALNFGFREDRESRSHSINGKMSEYHAAVGLAELDHWTDKRRALGEVAAHYREACAAVGLAGRFCGGPELASTYALLRLDSAARCRDAQQALAAEGIESRLWYGGGLQLQPCLRGLPRDALPCTERVAPTLLGLPMAPDLDRRTLGRVVDVVARASGVA